MQTLLLAYTIDGPSGGVWVLKLFQVSRKVWALEQPAAMATAKTSSPLPFWLLAFRDMQPH